MIGRPTKFTLELQSAMLHMATLGYTDDKIAQACKVTYQTINNWKNEYPDFFESLKQCKLIPDEEVERSLYERALGYSTTETKSFLFKGKIVSEDVTKHYPPDPTSMIFWLKNRQPDKWRDKRELEIGPETQKAFNLAYKLDKDKPPGVKDTELDAT